MLSLLTSLSLKAFADFNSNLRWSLDASARLNHNEAINNTSRIYAFGLDSHKVFTRESGDFVYGVGQIYFTKLSNHLPVPFLFDDKDDGEFVIREAHLNYIDTPRWFPHIRIGHFTMPFGLEESIDTNGRLLDYYHGKNLGTKLDWGLSLNKVTDKFDYNISYTLGGKNKVKSIDGSYAVTGRIGTLNHYDFIIGLSFYRAEIDRVNRKRLALDLQYYWQTWGVLAELALGEDDKLTLQWQQEKYVLFELNKTALHQQLKVYSQIILTDKEFQSSTEKLVNIGLSYQVNTQLEFSLSGRVQLNTPIDTNKQELARAQIRYRY